MAGGGGGAWKVAYADFVTAMMAFFLVMWLTSQNKAVKESVAQYFENPLGTATEARASSVHGIPGASSNTPLEGQQAGPHGSSHRDVFQGGSDKGQTNARPIVRIFEKLGRTRDIGTMILFKKDSIELDDDAKAQVGTLLPSLMGKPNKIEVRGHSVRGPLPQGSSYPDHWSLCFARCLKTMKFLTDNGIEPDRIRLSQDGEFEPYSQEANAVHDPRNARVEIFAVSEFTAAYKESLEQRAGDFVPAPEHPLPEPKLEVPEAKSDGHGSGHGGGHGGGHGEAKPAKKSGGHGH